MDDCVFILAEFSHIEEGGYGSHWDEPILKSFQSDMLSVMEEFEKKYLALSNANWLKHVIYLINSLIFRPVNLSVGTTGTKYVYHIVLL